MKSRRLRKSITILTILAMLFLLLPMAVMAEAEGNGKKDLPSQASPRARLVRANQPVDDQDLDEEELEEEDEEMGEPSERALFVAERNSQAKACGIPPGLFDKLSVFTDGRREEICDSFKGTESGIPMRIKDLVKAIREARMMLETGTDLPIEQ